MTDQDKLADIRQELPAVSECAYLNTGTCGPLPRRTTNAIQTEAERELLRGRIDFDGYMRLLRATNELRERMARLLGADAEEIALTHHTTEGMNIGTWGLNWKPGDELITTTLEHEGGLLPAYMAGRRLGVTVRVVDLGSGEADVVGQLEQAITPRTRLISVSHVSFSSGARLPLAEIVEMAHRHRVLVLADGAQSAGAMPIDLHALGVDMYAVPGQKWLCGPEGIGALYVRRDRLSEIQPTNVGFLSLWPDLRIDFTGEFQLSPDARRYEVGSVFRPAYYGMLESLRWLEDEVGWSWAFERIAALSQEAVTMLEGLDGVRVLTPPNRAGLIAFTLDGHAPDEVVAGLAQRGIRIRPIKHFRCLRVCTGFFNTSEELSLLADALTNLPSGGGD